MQLIDTHSHLYGPEFSEDRSVVLHRAQKAGVGRIYLPAIDSETHADLLALEAQYPDACRAMMGLHPCYVKENYRQELDLVRQYLDQRTGRPFAAIGEIGLDHYWDKTHAAEQVVAFTTQMEWALEKNLPIAIHTRNAMQETIDLVKPFAKKGLRGVFHCFSGSAESAQQIVQLGFLLGIGGVITYKNAGLPAALKDIDLAHLVLETDAPYLAPVPFRGKRNEPAYLRNIADALAQAKSTTVLEIAAQTSANALKLFAASA
ncbi:MAG: TatD family deoxyribonuclease [Sphingobacteriia bacterium]|nr:MAG: TatD family deoxyribonuclease [Sphingobacteriia bacterium]